MSKKKKKDKKNNEVVLNKNMSSVDIRKAILYAYFDDIKPEKPNEIAAFNLLSSVAAFNLKP